jgi:hypothetical protein
VVGRPTGGEPRSATAIQAAHRCLDKLGADLAAAEEELDVERTRLAEAWSKLHEVVENSRKADEAARLHREKARLQAKEIRESAATEAKEILEEVWEKLAEVEAYEGTISACEFIREEALSAREKALEGALAAREKALEKAFAIREKAHEESFAAHEKAHEQAFAAREVNAAGREKAVIAREGEARFGSTRRRIPATRATSSSRRMSCAWSVAAWRH